MNEVRRHVLAAVLVAAAVLTVHATAQEPTEPPRELSDDEVQALFKRAQDNAEAVAWYRLAAEQGHADAQFNLGWMYASGRGVPQDDVTAHMWLNVAAATGHEQARKNRDSVAANMTREQIAEAQARARDWVNR